MKLNHTLPFIILMVCFLLLESCKKNNPGTTYIPTELKEYGIFQEGSYWVYKNDVTEKLDSLYLTTSPVFSYFKGGDSPIMEKCEVYYGGGLIKSSLSLWPDYYATMSGGISNLCLTSSSFEPGFTTGSWDFLFKNINHIDSLVINNHVYKDVMNTSCRTISLEGDTTIYTFYISRFIGFVKISQNSHNHDTIWSIVRYHVLQ